MRLTLFDLDGTLLDGDTDELWCEFLIDEGVLDRAEFEARNRSVVERYRAGAITPAEFCAFYASTLQGRSRDGWAAAARAVRRGPGPAAHRRRGAIACRHATATPASACS